MTDRSDFERLRKIEAAALKWDAAVQRDIEIHAGPDVPMGSWGDATAAKRRAAWELRKLLAPAAPSTKGEG